MRGRRRCILARPTFFGYRATFNGKPDAKKRTAPERGPTDSMIRGDCRLSYSGRRIMPTPVLLLLHLWQGPHRRLRQQELDPGQPFELVGRDGNHSRAKSKHTADVDLDFIVGSFDHLDNFPKSPGVGTVDVRTRSPARLPGSQAPISAARSSTERAARARCVACRKRTPCRHLR
jgi:hypothetical protein